MCCFEMFVFSLKLFVFYKHLWILVSLNFCLRSVALETIIVAMEFYSCMLVLLLCFLKMLHSYHLKYLACNICELWLLEAYWLLGCEIPQGIALF